MFPALRRANLGLARRSSSLASVLRSRRWIFDGPTLGPSRSSPPRSSLLENLREFKVRLCLRLLPVCREARMRGVRSKRGPGFCSASRRRVFHSPSSALLPFPSVFSAHAPRLRVPPPCRRRLRPSLNHSCGLCIERARGRPISAVPPSPVMSGSWCGPTGHPRLPLVSPALQLARRVTSNLLALVEAACGAERGSR